MVIKVKMTIMTRKPPVATESVNVAEAKRRFSELLGRVAYGGATLLITRRGRPMAKLVPPHAGVEPKRLSEVAGWLDDDDPFFAGIDETLARRSRTPRVLVTGSRRKST